MINRRIKNRHRYRSLRGMLSYGKKPGGKIYKEIMEIMVPEVISLDPDNRDRLLSFIFKIHSLVKQHNKICFNFSRTKKVFSDGMLLLYAEVVNLININSLLNFSCKLSKNIKINHVLKQLGMLDIFHRNFKKTMLFTDVVDWRVCEGTGVIRDKYDDIIENTDQMKALLDGVNLYKGCTEATQNASVHAYIKQRELSVVNNKKTSWWIFSQIKDDKLSVCVCDLGIGIAKTLPTKPALYKQILSTLVGKKITDSKLIQGAIEIPSSRTGEDYRGNGLKAIAQVAHDKEGASLKIFSGKACVVVSKNGIVSRDFSTAVPGTVVSWTLPLGE